MDSRVWMMTETVMWMICMDIILVMIRAPLNREITVPILREPLQRSTIMVSACAELQVEPDPTTESGLCRAKFLVRRVQMAPVLLQPLFMVQITARSSPRTPGVIPQQVY